MKIQLSDHFTYKKLFRLCLPTIAMMMFSSVYYIVDGFFVSNFVGKSPFAAINLIMPFLMIMCSLGFMVGTGGNALVSKTLGEGDRKKANEYFTMLFVFVLILGIACSVIGFILMRPIAIALGGSGELLEGMVLYGQIMNLFNVAFMLQLFFQTMFTVAEKPLYGFLFTMGAGLTNIVLDALFIAVFKWGLLGASLASVLGQCVGGVLPIFYFLRKNNSLLKFTKFSWHFAALGKACLNGMSEFMTNVSASVVGMLYNMQLMRLAGENGVSAYGVLMYTHMVFSAIFIGYAIGVAPVVGYHYGAQNDAELQNLRRKSLWIMSLCGVAMMGFGLAISGTLAQIFVGYDAELLAITKHAFLIFSTSFLLSGINIFTSTFFTALNNGPISAVVSFSRTCIFQISAVLLLPCWLQLDGVWWALPVAELCAVAMSVLMLCLFQKKYHY